MGTILDATKRVASLMPAGLQEGAQYKWDALRRMRGKFKSPEPEWAMLGTWVKTGDTVLDIGANTGVFTWRLAEIVGFTGRVIAFEPLPATFRRLAENVAKYDNVTLVNAAVSDQTGTVRMSVPKHKGWNHPSRASITATGLTVMSVALDGLNLPRIEFVKIDVEGHELPALQGMRRLLERDRPRLLVERNDPKVEQFLVSLGYTVRQYDLSPNNVYI